MTIIEHVLTMDANACARAANDLNTWRWPSDFPAELKPLWWDREDLHNNQRKHGFYTGFAPFFAARAGNKRIRKDWLKRYVRHEKPEVATK